MTLISIVVPVYKVQGYLRECLDSILGQSFTDIEVVAVDDCSPDSSGQILAEYAARDPRLTVLSLPANVGLGAARNAGLDAATGEYVWFLDSDDWLTDGALRAVANRLRASTPDVLIVDHVRVFWDYTQATSALRQAFPTAPGAEVFDVRTRPETLRVLHTAWNKVTRRQFLVDLGLRFADGWYEDVSFTFPLLVAARRVTVLDRVCVNYRQRRTGAITRTRSARHFEMFDHWGHTFDWLDAHDEQADEVRPQLFALMIAHYLMVLGHGSRLPRELHRDFFTRAHADYRRRLPAGGYAVPGGVEGLKRRLLAAGRWRTFAALRVVQRARKMVRAAVLAAGRPVKRGLRELARTSRRVLLRGYYRLRLRLPMDPNLALYAAYWYRGYSCNPAAIHAKAAEMAPQIESVWVVRRDRAATMPPGVPYVVAGTWRYYRALARATWLINNVNFPDYVRKRPGSVHVQTHHGTPVKVMGLDQQRHPIGATSMNFPNLLRRVDRWDFSISANTFSTQMWERAYPGGFVSIDSGYPRNDRLALATADDVAAARTSLGIAPGERVVLYLPTHREHQPGWRPEFDADEFAEVIGPDGWLLVRSHYFHDRDRTGRAPDAPATGRVRDMSAHPVVEDLYLAADVLITDYSSAMFDYAVLDRPIVIYAPDAAAYAMARGVYFDITAEAPGAVATTFGHLLDVFRTGAVDDDAAIKARTQFRARFCHLDDGHAAERVVRRALLGERD
ncbi:bifunctional glycosyltransferase family 2 protein/CDP-glycerol:glycerophosphate glycerophosphotransferase [Solwaraspora sp. WMMD406]|uniref:bifunctional glycosyltransferase/CDP-glycerol:glycerophosphate glycerophosphotransferase n=1 Tax=Solwaraspora sp. WMMD406 TaxID=3016095 RepID=UPI0024172086|nr:bifunctional glycosyltransferase family 2 protein/CDP-glycerol:glycerophosphate glycerophosphotransferase [Solwaraspora sp. WMMD406]MDG4763489.1 bifunctional glycosyltransferase family 2 protein/CDP-glycerol:glycerophosphate glycerophosphotransferase [Solwaraspora sp. WMMD406]